eukprot:TRINITY_DN38681_c0_g2_i3.p1 TRINITY_DN38681_c0_g2~~TRINITY_DN38681_c0_g2_i3.p1  ORF type:complete len:744 (+),score=121.86 TRINITY_DN38681_c0_g2_i3:179-2410(+)
MNGMSRSDSPWLDLYQVMVLTFGQQFPEGDVSIQDQVFSVFVVTIGLGAFALVLALVEQVFMEFLEKNVQQGSLVYEKGHVLVLSWCNSPRDVEVVRKILRQTCDAYQNDGGVAVVVLSQKEKAWMEQQFARAIPESIRKGTRFIFREGNPLIPSNLNMVAAKDAASVVIVSDNSRSQDEADAQSIRAAVLLDEMELVANSDSDGPPPNIIVEMRTRNAVPLLQYACSPNVIAFPSNQLNARRLTRMVKQPVIASVSKSIWSFQSETQVFLHSFPELQGLRFSELAFYFPDGVVFGVVENDTGKTLLSPPQDYVLPGNTEIVVLRPIRLDADRYPQGRYRPNGKRVVVDQQDWEPDEGVMLGDNEVAFVYMDEEEDDNNLVVGVRGGSDDGDDVVTWDGEGEIDGQPVRSGGVSSDFYILPPEFTQTMDVFEPTALVIFGWGSMSFMADLLRELDRGGAQLPFDSQITVFSSHDPENTLDIVLRDVQPQNISVQHVYGDPLEITDVRKLPFEYINRAMILCDDQWLDPDMDASNGISLYEENEILRLDSMVMMAQLNVRQVVEEKELPEMNIICEKLSFQGSTRFEDRFRLPLGISVNFTAFAAKMLTEAIYNPKVLLVFAQLGNEVDFHVIDSCYLAQEGEELTWWDLAARAQKLELILVGYYEIPLTIKKTLDLRINIHEQERNKSQIWNVGNQRVKLLTLTRKQQKKKQFDFRRDRLDQFLVEAAKIDSDSLDNAQIPQS